MENELFIEVVQDIAQDMILCYVKTDEICYALKYDCYTGSGKNVYLVKLNTDRNKIINEYSATGEIISLSSGDVCRLYQGGDKVYLSINNVDVRQFNLPNSEQLQQNQPFEFHSMLVNNDLVDTATEANCVSVIDSERFYTHQNQSQETGKDENSIAESEDISDSTEANSSTETEAISDGTECSITVTTTSKTNDNNSNSKVGGIVICIVVLLIIVGAAVFVYFKFLKDKIWTIFNHKKEDSAIGQADRIDNSQKKIRIKNESSLVTNLALKYPVDKVLTNQDLTDEKDELIGKRISQIKSIKFRYKINHRDYIFVECFKSGVNITNELMKYSVFLLAFNRDYELIIGILEKNDCMVIKKFRDYACSINVSVADLLTILSNHSDYQCYQANGIFRSMIDLMKATTSLLYNDSGSNSGIINKLYVYTEKVGLEKIESVCKEARVIDVNQKIKVIISYLIELYMAKPQNANFRANAWNGLEMRICELMNQLSELIPQPVENITQQSNQSVIPQSAASEPINDVNAAINKLNTSSFSNSPSTTLPNASQVAQAVNKEATQSTAYYHKEDFMALYHNTKAFLSEKNEIQYFSPSNDSTVFNSGSYTLEVASYNWAADFIAIGDKLFLNPSKYKNAYLDDSQRKDLRLDIIFKISGFNGRGSFSNIEPAIVDLYSLKVISNGTLCF